MKFEERAKWLKANNIKYERIKCISPDGHCKPNVKGKCCYMCKVQCKYACKSDPGRCHGWMEVKNG